MFERGEPFRVRCIGTRTALSAKEPCPDEQTDQPGSGLAIRAGTTKILFKQAPSDFDGAYHFAFNIPENQYHPARKWISTRIPLLKDKSGKEDFTSESWNSDSIYISDPAGNILEFIARHTLKNAVDGDYDSSQILNVSEKGLPSENVIEFANPGKSMTVPVILNIQ